jgi:hypothetical protein
MNGLWEIVEKSSIKKHFKIYGRVLGAIFALAKIAPF